MPPYNTYRLGESTYITRVCRTLYVAALEFDYSFAAFLLPEPLSHFFRLKRSWDYLFRALPPDPCRTTLAALSALLPFLRLQSFAHESDAHSPALRLSNSGSRSSLEVSISEAFSPTCLQPLSGCLLFRTSRIHSIKSGTLCLRVFLTSDWLDLLEIVLPL